MSEKPKHSIQLNPDTGNYEWMPVAGKNNTVEKKKPVEKKNTVPTVSQYGNVKLKDVTVPDWLDK